MIERKRIQVKAVFDAGCKWRLVEEFGPHCFEEQADGKLLFYADYTDYIRYQSYLPQN